MEKGGLEPHSGLTTTHSKYRRVLYRAHLFFFYYKKKMIHEDLSGISLIAVESFNLLVVRCVFVVGCTVLYYYDGWVFRIFIFFFLPFEWR